MAEKEVRQAYVVLAVLRTINCFRTGWFWQARCTNKRAAFFAAIHSAIYTYHTLFVNIGFFLLLIYLFSLLIHISSRPVQWIYSTLVNLFIPSSLAELSSCALCTGLCVFDQTFVYVCHK